MFSGGGKGMQAIGWAGKLAREIVPTIDPGPRERSLLRLHLASALLSGATLGILNMADAIFVKTLGASPFEVTIFSLCSGVSYLGVIFWSAAMRHRRKAPFVLAAALAGRLGLGLIGISSARVWYILLLGIAWLAQALIVTAQTQLVQRAYPERLRGRLFGLTLSAATLTRLLTTVAAGWLLDWNEEYYVPIFAAAGAIGFAGAWLLARMEHRMDGARERAAQPPDAMDLPAQRPDALRRPARPALRSGLRSVNDSTSLVMRIFRQDHRYRRFQRNYFLYGIAFLSLTPIIPLFLVRELSLNYGQIGIAKGFMGQAGMLVFPLLFGRMLERVSPSRFCGRVFGLLALFPAMLLLASIVPAGLRVPLVYAAFLIMGTAMAGIDISWHISSIDFAGREDPSAYQAVHVVLTGVRGSIAPLIGYGIIAFGRSAHAFVLSFALFALSSVLMLRMARGESRPRAPAESVLEPASQAAPQD